MNGENLENLKSTILQEEEKGNIVFNTIEGLMVAKLDNFLKQPVDGVLYDLNRDRVTVLTNLKDNPKWVNDFAVSIVITELYKKLDIEKRRREAAEALYMLKFEYELNGEADEEMEFKIKQAYDTWQSIVNENAETGKEG